MTTDPIVEQIKRYRKEHAAKFNYNLRAIIDDARHRQGTDGRKVVRRPPRIPHRQPANERSPS